MRSHYYIIVIILTIFFSGCAHLNGEGVSQKTPSVNDNSSQEIINNTPLPESLPDEKEVVVSKGEVIQDIEYEEEDEKKGEAEDSEDGQMLLDTALEFCKTAQEFWNEGNLERAIESLDQAYNLVLQVDAGNNPELIQQKEDLRFMISKRILEIMPQDTLL
jgi:membrane-bound lytic murein transglycosylase D